MAGTEQLRRQWTEKSMPTFMAYGPGHSAIRVVRGTWSGRSNRIAAQIAHVQQYIDDRANGWPTAQEYHDWAVTVMRDALRNMADGLVVEDK